MNINNKLDGFFLLKFAVDWLKIGTESLISTWNGGAQGPHP